MNNTSTNSTKITRVNHSMESGCYHQILCFCSTSTLFCITGPDAIEVTIQENGDEKFLINRDPATPYTTALQGAGVHFLLLRRRPFWRLGETFSDIIDAFEVKF